MDILSADFDFISQFSSVLDKTESENMWSLFEVGKSSTRHVPNKHEETDEEENRDAEKLFTELENTDFHDVFLTEASQDDSSNSNTTFTSLCEKSLHHCADVIDLNIVNEKQDHTSVVTSQKSSISKSNESQNVLSKSNTRNAIMARRFRQKRKEYITELETSREMLITENDELKEKQKDLQNSVKDLQHEVKYLRSLLSNGSELSTILQTISNVPGMKISNNILQPTNRKRPASVVDHAYTKLCSPAKIKQPNAPFLSSEAGICVHVSSGCVSVEMCHKCNENHVKSKASSSDT